MTEEILAKAHEVLDNIWRAIITGALRSVPLSSTPFISMGEHFSIEDLGRELTEKEFSR